MRIGNRSLYVVILVAGLVLMVRNPAHAQLLYSESFTYSDGPLSGNGGWSGATAGAIDVASGAVAMTGGATVVATTVVLPTPVGPCEDGTITTIVHAKGGGGSVTLYSVEFNDTNGNNLGRWNSTGSLARGRIGATGLITSTPTLSTVSFDELKAVINVKKNTTEFFFNGSSIGLLDHSSSASNIGNSVGQITIQRLAGTTGADTIFFDDISVTSCPGTCAATVTPSSNQNAFAPVAGAATPGSVTYTIKNILATSLSYTVAEVDSSGAPFDYSWLSLNHTSGGPLATNATDTVVATLDPVTPGLAAGIYDGMIKFTDDCSPNRSYTRIVRLFVGTNLACFAETFPYPNGAINLVGDDWALTPVTQYVGTPIPTDTTGALEVSGNKLSVKSVGAANGSFIVTKQFPPVGPDANGKITCKVYMEKGTGDTGSIWKIFYQRPEDGLTLAEWDGQVGVVRPRDELQDDPAGIGSGFGNATTGPGNLNINLTGTGTFDEIAVVIDTINATGQYLVNGTPVGSFLPSPDPSKSFVNDSRMKGCRIGRVTIQRQNRGTGAFNMSMNWDNVLIQGDCNVIVPLGSVVATSPVGGSALPASFTYSLLNSNSTMATDTVQELDGNGALFDNLWISPSKTTLGPVSSEGTDSLLANIVPGALPGGEYVGQLKFTDSSAPAISQTRALKLILQDQDCFIENFPYTDGNLLGQPGWTNTTPSASNILLPHIQMNGGAVKLGGGTIIPVGTPVAPLAYTVVHPVDTACQACPTNGLISVKMKARGGKGASFIWTVALEDTSATPLVLASWNGQGTIVRGRQGGSVTSNQLFSNCFAVTGMNWTDATKLLTKVGAFAGYTFTAGDSISLTAGTGVTIGAYDIVAKISNDTIQLASDINGAAGDIADSSIAGNVASVNPAAPFDNLEILINTTETTVNGIPANASKYFFNGVPMGAANPIGQATGAGDAIGRIRITRESNLGGVGHFVFLDDISVHRCVQFCNDPVFDVRDESNTVIPDGKVTTNDFNVFAACAPSGTTADRSGFNALPFECRCMDVNGNHALDIDDFGRFQRCYTGSTGTVDPNCDN